MDSHSRSASPREPMRPQHRPPSPPASPGAFDNQAYQHDESDPNHNDSFSSNGPQQQNGHTKEPNGETKTLEAVNLELINLAPKNGNAKKKDVEVDMNASNPYDEYFVPVNEHRKYMRGEKLYVTADKRGEKGGCKRPLCWTLLGLVVAAIVAIIVLAATGVLFTNSPTPLEQYNTSVSTARALGGVGHVHHNHDHNTIGDHDHIADHGLHSVETTEHQHGPEPQSDEGREPSLMSDETVDTTMYVPRTVEGELKIDNEEYTSELQDPESNEYREFVMNFSEGIKRALFDRNSLENGDNEITVEVIQLKPGSVVVTYRVHWKPKLQNAPTEDLLNANTLEARLDAYLNKNNRMINVYHIAEEKLVTKPVLDVCQMNLNGCEHGCEFNEVTLDFTCTCQYGEILDMANPQRCIPLLGSGNEKSTEDTKASDFTVQSVNANPVTTKMIPEEENPTTESVNQPRHTFDWTETHHRMPETTTETETDVNFSHIFGHSTKKPEETTETMKPDSSEENSVPEPEPEPKTEPEPSPELETIAEPNPTTEPEPTSVPEPTSEPEHKSAFEPKSESEPTPEPEPKAEPEPVVESNPQPTAEQEPEPTTEPEPKDDQESKSEPEPTSEPEPVSEAQPEPFPEPKPEPEPEPEVSSTTPETVALNPAFMFREEKQSEDHALKSETTTEPEPTSSPMAESFPEANTQTSHSIEKEISHTLEYEARQVSTAVTEESVTTVTDNEHQSEHHIDQSESSEEKSVLYTNEGKYEYKPIEDTQETTTRRISLSEPNLINEPSYEPKPEIISILSAKQENNESNSSTNTNDETSITTESSDWLEQQSQDSAKLVDHNQTQFEDINNNANKIMHESEQRSFKTFDEDFLVETTTTSNIYPVNENDSLDLVSKYVENPSTAITKRMEDETQTPVAILPVNEETSEGEMSIAQTTTKSISIMPAVELEMTTAKTETVTEDSSESKTGSMITSVHEEAKSIESNKSMSMETTTSEPVTIKQFYINKHYQDSDGDKLLEVLENKHHSEKNETTTEREVEEGMDITFDAINMLYNRSSKSIEKKLDTSSNNSSMQDTTEDTSFSADSSTDSDWLSEAVTEINYEEAMNKMEKHETTESSLSKIDEIMKHGQVKDDFEPDYLNNMGTNGNKQEQDEPLYGMTHDYDNDDSRFKRVNKAITTESVKNVSTQAGDVEKNNSGVIVNTNVPVETTTVSEYIYKVAVKPTNDPDVSITEHEERNNNSLSPVMENETPAVDDDKPSPLTTEEPEPTMKAEPAPVWEESDSEKYLTVKELPKKMEQSTEIQHPVMIDEIRTNSSTGAPTNMLPINENSENSTITEMENSDLSASQNTTQLSNLNVTIYEISSHSGNNSGLLAKSGNAQSAEYDDHETEMNPFLPEVENNKSLVKKLQEGHDLEPNNLTETQNENTEEHIKNQSEGLLSSNNESLAVIGKEADTVTNKPEQSPPTASEDDTSFNELLMAGNKTDTDTTTIPATLKKPQKLPISTFLLDTDDLDTLTTRNNKVDATTSSAVHNNDGGFLSVVPIKEQNEDLLEQHKSENIAELNDISDLPKSDKRTLDGTKFDSVINNEA